VVHESLKAVAQCNQLRIIHDEVTIAIGKFVSSDRQKSIRRIDIVSNAPSFADS
jgi:hypothetical protein